MRANEIPLWLIASLGKPVELVSSFSGPCRVYPAGSVGVLTSIQAYHGPMHVTVALDPEDDTYWENFSFDQVRPAQDRVEFSLDLEHGAIAF